jgi:hypothetical protein
LTAFFAAGFFAAAFLVAMVLFSLHRNAFVAVSKGIEVAKISVKKKIKIFHQKYSRACRLSTHFVEERCAPLI